MTHPFKGGVIVLGDHQLVGAGEPILSSEAIFKVDLFCPITISPLSPNILLHEVVEGAIVHPDTFLPGDPKVGVGAD